MEEEIFERNEEELTDLDEYIKGHEMLTTKYYLKGKEAEKVLVYLFSKSRKSIRSWTSSRPKTRKTTSRKNFPPRTPTNKKCSKFDSQK